MPLSFVISAPPFLKKGKKKDQRRWEKAKWCFPKFWLQCVLQIGQINKYKTEIHKTTFMLFTYHVIYNRSSIYYEFQKYSKRKKVEISSSVLYKIRLEIEKMLFKNIIIYIQTLSILLLQTTILLKMLTKVAYISLNINTKTSLACLH